MFYPEESLKKGGRFYLCWVADSWPLCFATITHRQLWSQDIRKICDDLLEVMNNESGRPAGRFSLRLSSQLMRGLVRLYQRKVVIMLGDLCMINARVMKNSNKKFNILEPAEMMERQLFPPLEPVIQIEERVEERAEERVEEILQQSGNIVSNVQDITLKEATIPDFQLQVNDGFGEENPNQALQLLQDRTLEHMLGASSSAVHSGLDLPQDRSAAADVSREPRPVADPQMEMISEHDLTLFRKSTAPEILPEEFEKDIPIPEIPPPEPPAPTEKEVVTPEPDVAPVPIPPTEVAVRPPTQPEPVELEELCELEPQAKRRRKHKLIIDKRIILPSSYLRARLENIALELRCENSSDDIADLRVPSDILFGRPAAAGERFLSAFALPLTRLFARNLGVGSTLPQREMELALASRRRRAPSLEIIPEEVPQAIPELLPLEPQLLQPEEVTMLDQTIVVPDLRPSVAEDIADLPTQKLPTSPQKLDTSPQKLATSPQKLATSPQKGATSPQKLATPPQKRRASQDDTEVSKRQRRSGVVTRQHLRRSSQREEDIVEKENIPDNRQIFLPTIEEQLIPDIEILPASDPEKRLTSMLQEAGLADLEIRPEVVQVEEESQRKREESQRKSRRPGSESSETMLGSLDRTKVSLGDSEHTTDSKRFIRPHNAAVSVMRCLYETEMTHASTEQPTIPDVFKDSSGSDHHSFTPAFLRPTSDQWGTEGTMVKILKAMKEAGAVGLDALLARGPFVPGCRRLIAARCFSSILKLKQHGFINVNKDPDTLEVTEILLGPKFD